MRCAAGAAMSTFAPSISSNLTGAICASSHYTERRRGLAKLVHKPRAGLLLDAQFEDDGALVFQHACLLGCERIVSKRKHSRYRSGRSRDWVKMKNR